MRQIAWRALLGLWLAAAVISWNTVFDAHVRAGAREYVDRQNLFVQGRGARVDMDAVMDAAVSSGLRAATLYALLLLSPAAVVVMARLKGRGKAVRGGVQGRPRHHP